MHKDNSSVLVHRPDLSILFRQHLVVDIVRAMDAFIGNMTLANGALKYFGVVNSSLNIVKTATYVAVTLVSDAFIVSLSQVPRRRVLRQDADLPDICCLG